MATARVLALCSRQPLTPQLQPIMMLQAMISLISVCERVSVSLLVFVSPFLVTRCVYVCLGHPHRPRSH